ncbi:MAG: hypothetical protein KDK65_06600, partial [Chlamydiia bacterium]|nr:hypothetical protein [Chlamydiia bacterium]
VPVVDAVLQLRNHPLAGICEEIFGKQAQVKINYEGKGFQHQFTATVNAEEIRGELVGSADQKMWKIKTEKPWQFRITPEIYAKLVRNIDTPNLPRLIDETHGTLSLDNLELPYRAIETGDDEAVHFSGDIHFDEPHFATAEGDLPMNFSTLAVQFETDPEDFVHIHVSGEGEAEVDLNLLYQKPITSLLRKDEARPKLLMNWKANLLETTTTGTVNWTDDTFQTQGEVNAHPFQAFGTLKGKEMTYSGTFHDRFAVDGKWNFMYGQQLKGDYNIKWDNLLIEGNSQIDFEAKKGDSQWKLSGSGVNGKASASLSSGHVLVLADVEQGAENHLKAHLAFPLKKPEEGNYLVKAKLRSFPLNLVPESQKLMVTFGPTADLNCDFTMEKGAIKAKGILKSDRAEMHVNGQVIDQVITLNEPFRLHARVTEPFVKEILAPLIPIFDAALSSQERLHLVIHPENFRVPLHSPLEGTVPSVHLSLGKMEFQNRGEIAKAIHLLQPLRKPTYSIWFTPIYASLSDQTIQIQRFDYLVNDRFPLATWGKIHFDENNLNMVIAITPDALSQAYLLPEINTNLLMQIPLKGPLSKPKIDTTRVVTALTSIAALSLPGPQRPIVNSAIDIIAAVSPNQPPAPTTSPLPWPALTPPPPTVYDSIEDGVKKGIQKAIDKIGSGLNF